MNRRPLTPAALGDAKRLRGLIEKDERSQIEIAAACGWKSQGSVSQYMHGRIPLNLVAAQKFAEVLGVELEKISPSFFVQSFPLPQNWRSHPKIHEMDDGTIPEDELRALAVDMYRTEGNKSAHAISPSFAPPNNKVEKLKSLSSNATPRTQATIAKIVQAEMDGRLDDGLLDLIDQLIERERQKALGKIA